MRTGGNYSVEKIEDTRPLALHADIDLQPGETSNPNAISLVNPHDEPWEVHEVKFSVRPQIALDDDGNLIVGQASGALLSAELHAGEEPLTSGLVPVWGFGPAYEPDMEYVQAFNWGRPATPSSVLQYWDVWIESLYRWRFDHPLYLQSGQAIVPSLKHTGLSNQPITAGITVSGRRLLHAPKPRVIKVPFAAAWQSEFYDATSDKAEEQSPETALRNQFSVPLTVERFIGRICQKAQSDEGGERFASIAEAFEGPWSQHLFKVRQFDNKGNTLVRYPAGFRSVYGYRTRAWHCRHVLSPAAYHKILLTKEDGSDLTLFTQGEAPATVYTVAALQASAQVSMIGWREVRL